MSAPTEFCQDYIRTRLTSSVNCPPFVATLVHGVLMVYMTIPKSYHASVQETIRSECSRVRECTFHEFKISRGWGKHSVPPCIDSLRNRLRASRVEILSYVREPVERCVSGIREAMYYMGHNLSIIINTLENRTLDRHFAPQTLRAFPTDSNGTFLNVHVRNVRDLELKIHLDNITDEKKRYVPSEGQMTRIRRAMSIDYRCMWSRKEVPPQHRRSWRVVI